MRYFKGKKEGRRCRAAPYQSAVASFIGRVHHALPAAAVVVAVAVGAVGPGKSLQPQLLTHPDRSVMGVEEVAAAALRLPQEDAAQFHQT